MQDDNSSQDSDQHDATTDKMKMVFGVAFMVCVTAIIVTILVLIFN